MPAKRKATTGKPTDDSSKKDKAQLVQSTLESCNDLDSIWEPTDDEIDEITDICDQLKDDENDDYNDGSVLTLPMIPILPRTSRRNSRTDSSH